MRHITTPLLIDAATDVPITVVNDTTTMIGGALMDTSIDKAIQWLEPTPVSPCIVREKVPHNLNDGMMCEDDDESSTHSSPVKIKPIPEEELDIDEDRLLHGDIQGEREDDTDDESFQDGQTDHIDISEDHPGTQIDTPSINPPTASYQNPDSLIPEPHPTRSSPSPKPIPVSHHTKMNYNHLRQTCQYHVRKINQLKQQALIDEPPSGLRINIKPEMDLLYDLLGEWERISHAASMEFLGLCIKGHERKLTEANRKLDLLKGSVDPNIIEQLEGLSKNRKRPLTPNPHAPVSKKPRHSGTPKMTPRKHVTPRAPKKAHPRTEPNQHSAGRSNVHTGSIPNLMDVHVGQRAWKNYRRKQQPKNKAATNT